MLGTENGLKIILGTDSFPYTAEPWNYPKYVNGAKFRVIILLNYRNASLLIHVAYDVVAEDDAVEFMQK